MAEFEIKVVEDNTDKIKARLDDAVETALEMMGLQAVNYATLKCPVDTGRLRASITKEVRTKERQCIIGTNVKYAPYVEFGTGKFASDGRGRKTPWVYQDERGEWHRTYGSKPQPFFKPAITEHNEEYRRMAEQCINTILSQ